MNASVVMSLRDRVPLRPLSRSEAFRIAELQAQRFLAMSGVKEPDVSLTIITELPRLQVSVLRPFPASGATYWKNGVWMIILNGGEPATRQRFSLAHEFKHILDDRFVDLIYRGIPEADRFAFIEQVCDYFAGCLLVPRPWLKRLYGQGVQSPKLLARRFDVSQAAIETRLSQIGLGEPRPRCSRLSADWSVHDRAGGTRPYYFRESQPFLLTGVAA